MPSPSPKMYSFILGFQRLVWCPKWTPASSNSFMVILAKQPPLKSASVVPVANSGLLSRPRTGAREELENQLSAVSDQPSATTQTTQHCHSEPANTPY